MSGKFIFGLVLGSLFCAACQSKPVNNNNNNNGGKATRGAPGPLYSLELEATVSQSPRKNDDLEANVILNQGVQRCLREAAMKSGNDFSVVIEGQLSPQGEISQVKVENPYDSLRTCLAAELPNVDVGQGAGGAFKMQISRVSTTPPKSKTFLLDLNEPKKFQ